MGALDGDSDVFGLHRLRCFGVWGSASCLRKHDASSNVPVPARGSKRVGLKGQVCPITVAFTAGEGFSFFGSGD